MNEEKILKLMSDFNNISDNLDRLDYELENYINEYKLLGSYEIEKWELHHLVMTFEFLISIRRRFKSTIENLKEVNGSSNLSLMFVDSELRRRKENRPVKNIDLDNNEPFSLDDFDDNSSKDSLDQDESENNNLPF
jgi:hypothetical protein